MWIRNKRDELVAGVAFGGFALYLARFATSAACTDSPPCRGIQRHGVRLARVTRAAPRPDDQVPGSLSSHPRKNRRVLRWVQIQTNDVGRLRLKGGIVCLPCSFRSGAAAAALAPEC